MQERTITMTTEGAQIEDGMILSMLEDLPIPALKSTTIAVQLAGLAPVTLYAEPTYGPFTFSYKPDSYSHWHVELEPLDRDNQGRRQFRVALTET
jgi:hypothetical protein